MSRTIEQLKKRITKIRNLLNMGQKRVNTSKQILMGKLDGIAARQRSAIEGRWRALTHNEQNAEVRQAVIAVSDLVREPLTEDEIAVRTQRILQGGSDSSSSNPGVCGK